MAPTTIATSEQVARRVVKKNERAAERGEIPNFKYGGAKRVRSRNRGNGKNRNLA